MNTLSLSAEPIYTVAEVARYLKISKSKIFYLVAKKQIPHLKIGRNIRIRRGDLEAWLNSQIVRNKFDIWSAGKENPPG